MDKANRKTCAYECHRPSAELHSIKQQIYHLSKMSKPGLGPTQPLN